MLVFPIASRAVFQSTRPARGETCPQCLLCRGRGYFNPLAPHGARRAAALAGNRGRSISIHSPRTGRDAAMINSLGGDTEFQSTRPARGETGIRVDVRPAETISIHSPRTGHADKQLSASVHHFNPLAPHGARRSDEARQNSAPCYFNPLAPHGARPG